MLPFATTWMDVEGIMPRETRERQILYDVTYMGNLKNTTNELTHRYREETSGYHWGEGSGGNIGVEDKKGLLSDYMKSCV